MELLGINSQIHLCPLQSSPACQPKVVTHPAAAEVPVLHTILSLHPWGQSKERSEPPGPLGRWDGHETGRIGGLGRTSCGLWLSRREMHTSQKYNKLHPPQPNQSKPRKGQIHKLQKKKKVLFYLFCNNINICNTFIKVQTRSIGKRGRGSSPLEAFKSLVSPPSSPASCAVAWAGKSLSSKHTVLDPRQPFWLLLASPAFISQGSRSEV